jgi:NADPH:quinone reductase
VKAAVGTPNGPRRAELREVADPEPGAGDALVAVRAFAPNRGELRLLATRDEGWQPGQDLAGDVVRAAADGSGPAEGERVAGLADWHGWAELAAVPAHRLAAIPEGVSYSTAAALPMAGSTAANLVRSGGSLLGRRVLVTGGTGGVGHIAAQLAELAGATVDAVSSAADAPGDGYPLILESAGGPSIAAAVDKVAHGGTVVVFGNSAGEPGELDFRAFAGREASIESYFSARHEHEAGANLTMLLDLVSDGRLTVEVGLEASWTELNDALDALADRRVRGKAVLLVD